MKPLTRYISLLLICGLMLPLSAHHSNMTGGAKNVRAGLFPPAQALQTSVYNSHQDGFSFFKDVLANIAPTLKNLR